MRDSQGHVELADTAHHLDECLTLPVMELVEVNVKRAISGPGERCLMKLRQQERTQQAGLLDTETALRQASEKDTALVDDFRDTERCP